MDKIILTAPEKETYMEFKIGKTTIKSRTGSVEFIGNRCVERNNFGEITLIKEFEPVFKIEAF